MTILGIKIGAKIIGAIALIGLILLLVTCGPAACNRIRSLSTQVRVNEGQHDALKNSAADAINTIGTVNSNEAGRADQARHDTEEITNAQGAHDPINLDVYSAGLRAHCRRSAGALDPKCRVLQPHAP